ncbi:MAG: hypothetical protein LUC34_07575, partial [Campylobacter sp.]|nr:hypothetical protein [Campylobacter sp.]
MCKQAYIDGYTYAISTFKKVYKRVAVGKLESMAEDLPKLKNENEIKNFGFADIDGFGSEDIYAAGGLGDIWHFNGKIWTRIYFFGNLRLRRFTAAKASVTYLP